MSDQSDFFHARPLAHAPSGIFPRLLTGITFGFYSIAHPHSSEAPPLPPFPHPRPLETAVCEGRGVDTASELHIDPSSGPHRSHARPRPSRKRRPKKNLARPISTLNHAPNMDGSTSTLHLRSVTPRSALALDFLPADATPVPTAVGHRPSIGTAAHSRSHSQPSRSTRRSHKLKLRILRQEACEQALTHQLAALKYEVKQQERTSKKQRKAAARRARLDTTGEQDTA